VRRFLEENETIILFAQGLVFFSLGFAVWIQRRRATRLRLTQSLIWLAAFAFVEALAVWGYVFVPIQEGYLGEGVVDVLLVVRAVLQTAAFLFLLEFGLRLIVDERPRRHMWTALSALVWLGLLAGSGIVAANKDWSVGQWEVSVEALARHTILLPATVLAAVGLWRQRGELAEAGLRGIRPYAAATAGVLAVYAVIGGIVVDLPFWSPGQDGPDVARFGAGAIQLAVARGLAGLVLSVLAVKLLEIFEFEAKQRIESLDRARAVAEERARFGRDLHDGTIQSLYAAGLHLESVAITAKDPDVRTQVRQVVEGLNATITGIRAYISGLRQPDGDAAMIAARLEDLARHFSSKAGVTVNVRILGVDSAGPLPEEAGQHLEQVLREGLSNAARHGRARTIDVELTFAPDELDLLVTDDGTGIPDPPTHTGEGLRNIKERARRLGGRAEIGPAAGGGTRVSLAIPLDIEAPDESDSQPQEVLR
jgi:signal transduction histidine kinase